MKDENLEILFYDEAFFRRESTITRGWYLKGSKQKVSCPLSKEKVGVLGAVSPREERIYSLIFDGCDSKTFIFYIKNLLEEYKGNRKIVLILDNASSHKSKIVKEFVETIKDQLVLMYLPPYSPDLNPVERVWKDLRYRTTHNVFFDSYKALENKVIEYLKRMSKPNGRIKLLCCNIYCV